MIYLKLYEEHNSIPDKFIRLDSIGYVLDPEEGVLYPTLKAGGYDHNNSYEVGWDASIDGISDEDMELVEENPSPTDQDEGFEQDSEIKNDKLAILSTSV